jgi:D-alanyl-D-alanine carboxypeptidase/D-alanyl-D-alanine-endopeptidase (penicillin-binding protein 4)
MLGGPAAHLLRAKTGTLTRASALSGYITTHEGVPLVFSMLVNNYRHIADVWAAQDTFAEALACLKLAPSSSTGPLPLPLAEESGPP